MKPPFLFTIRWVWAEWRLAKSLLKYKHYILIHRFQCGELSLNCKGCGLAMGKPHLQDCWEKTKAMATNDAHQGCGPHTVEQWTEKGYEPYEIEKES